MELIKSAINPYIAPERIER